ncbi:Glycerol-3-phosphate dehydrogenase, mitochondrial 1 [Fusarium oxysporum f. sp. phaseoli]
MEAIASLVTSAVLLLWQTYLNSPLTSYTMATISSYFGPGSCRRPDPERVILDPTYLNPRPNDHDGILIEPDEFERNGKQYVRYSVRSSSTINLWPPGSVNRTRSLDSTDDSGAYPARDELPQATPSYGGIMVFQEITIDVEEGKETSRAQNNGTETSNTIVPEKTNSKSWPGAGIELQTMGHFGTNVQAGAQVSKDIVARRGASSHVTSFTGLVGHSSPAVPPPTFGADGTFMLPRFPRVRSRDEQLNKLRGSSYSGIQEYDVLVIGGSATGAYAALHAATRGLKVAVVGRDDFSSSTRHHPI